MLRQRAMCQYLVARTRACKVDVTRWRNGQQVVVSTPLQGRSTQQLRPKLRRNIAVRLAGLHNTQANPGLQRLQTEQVEPFFNPATFTPLHPVAA